METYIEKCIAKYIEGGYTLFPCKTDKTPKYTGWQKTQFNDENITKLLIADKCFGVLLTPLDMVLDYDPARNAPGQNQLKEFLKLIGLETPIDTFAVLTARKGLHLYFKKPEEIKVPSMYVKGFNAIEVKTKGRYVIGAGSEIKVGQYKILRNDPTQVMERK